MAILTMTQEEFDEAVAKAVAKAVAPLLEEIKLLREENARLREIIEMRYAKMLKEREEFMSRNCSSTASMYQGW